MTWRTLLAWRLRHYAQVTAKLMLRRWQTAVFVLAMASPAMMPMLQQLDLLGTPILVLTRPGPVWQAWSIWAGLLVIAWLWSSLQGEAVTGGAPWRHLCLQPLGRATRPCVDLAVLAITDLPLFIPFAAAAISVHATGSANAGWRVLGVLMLAAQLPCLQWQRETHLLGTITLLPSQFIGIGLVCMGWHPAWLPACLACALFLGIWPWQRSPFQRKTSKDETSSPVPGLAPHRPPWVNLLAINIRFLCDLPQRRKQLVLLLLAPLPVLLLGLCRAAQMRQGPTLLILTLTMVPLMFQVAGQFFDLRQMHAPLHGMLRAMGLTPSSTIVLNMAVLVALFALAAIPLAATLYAASHSLAALYVYPIGIMSVMAFSWLNQQGDHQLFLVKVAIATMCCWALIDLIPR